MTREIDVLVVIEAEIATTHLIARILKACEAHSIRYRQKQLSELKVTDIKKDTVPLLIRSCAPSIEIWIKALVKANHPYMYYIDDNFWKIVGDSPLARYYQHPTIKRSLDLVVRNAAIIIANSQELADFIFPFNQNVQVLSPFFDFKLLEGTTVEETKEIRIGFAGSTSRADDLGVIAPTIAPILAAFPQVIFEFAGVLPNGVMPSERIRFFGYQDSYEEFIRFQAGRNWRVGLAPLLDSEPNRCKTNNKYREYGACGIAGIYSDIPPYKGSVSHHETGVLINNTTSDWLIAITELISNSELATRLGTNAKQDVRERYCVTNVAMQWSGVFMEADQTLQQALLKPLDLKLRSFDQFVRYIEWIRLQILMAYREGGLSVVFNKSIKRVARAMRSRF